MGNFLDKKRNIKWYNIDTLYYFRDTQADPSTVSGYRTQKYACYESTISSTLTSGFTRNTSTSTYAYYYSDASYKSSLADAYSRSEYILGEYVTLRAKSYYNSGGAGNFAQTHDTWLKYAKSNMYFKSRDPVYIQKAGCGSLHIETYGWYSWGTHWKIEFSKEEYSAVGPQSHIESNYALTTMTQRSFMNSFNYDGLGYYYSYDPSGGEPPGLRKYFNHFWMGEATTLAAAKTATLYDRLNYSSDYHLNNNYYYRFKNDAGQEMVLQLILEDIISGNNYGCTWVVQDIGDGNPLAGLAFHSNNEKWVDIPFWGTGTIPEDA